MNDEPTPDLARRPRPVTDELRAQIAEAHGRGLGRNEIARELKVAAGTVTKLTREAGLSFDRTDAVVATAARQADQAASRTLLAEKFLRRAHEQVDLMDAPTVLGSFGGRDNVWNETLLDVPTIEAQAVLFKTAALAARAHVELVKVDAARDVSTAEGTLDLLATGINAAVDHLRSFGPLEGDPTATDTVDR